MGTGRQLSARRADGLEFPVDVMLSPVEIGRRKVVITVVRDVTERWRVEQQRDEAERELRLAGERYRELSVHLEGRVEECTREVAHRSRDLDDTNRKLHEVNNVFMAMYERGDIYLTRLDRDGVVLDANPVGVAELGFPRADLLGKLFWEIGPWRISPQVAQWVHDRLKQAVAGERTRGESSCLTGNGEERVIEIAMIPIRDGDGSVTSVLATASTSPNARGGIRPCSRMRRSASPTSVPTGNGSGSTRLCVTFSIARRLNFSASRLRSSPIPTTAGPRSPPWTASATEGPTATTSTSGPAQGRHRHLDT